MSHPWNFLGIVGKNAVNTIDEDKRFIASWWCWIIMLFIFSGITFGILRYTGIIAETKIERIVFTNSQQYREARKTEQLTYKAELAKIESQLKRNDLSEATKADLRSQRAALEVMSTVSTKR